MTEADRIQYLRIVLVFAGLTFTFGILPLSIVWPSGWSWHSAGRSYYFEMILGIYATLGLFLLLAARNPLAHRSLIWFAVWSSIVHGVVMTVQSFDGDHHMGHLWGDVFALFAVAAVLAMLTPRESKANARSLPALRQGAVARSFTNRRSVSSMSAQSIDSCSGMPFHGIPLTKSANASASARKPFIAST